MQDEHGRTEYLSVATAHRSDCVFGSGFFRLSYGEKNVRFCQTWAEVQTACHLLEGVLRDLKIERDGYCLDGDSPTYGGDANTPDVVDGEWWLGLDRVDGMRELGLTSDADYKRAYDSIAAAVARRDNRASQGGVRASIVIKRPGARVTNVHV
jgi:hypothetical protein